MTRAILSTLSLVLAFAASAHADIPLPKNLKYVDPRVRFEGMDKHPDYVFVLRYLSAANNPAGIPHSLRPLKDTEPFNLNAARRILDFHVLALDRKEYDKRAKGDPTLQWLTDKTEGVLKANVNSPSTTASVTLKEAPITHYRVGIKNGKLTAEQLKVEKRSDAGPLPMWAFALVFVFAVAGLGIWFARRR